MIDLGFADIDINTGQKIPCRPRQNNEVSRQPSFRRPPNIFRSQRQDTTNVFNRMSLTVINNLD